MKKLISLLFLSFFIFDVNAQTGDISGKITNQNGAGIRYSVAAVVDSQGIKTGKGVKADKNGNYSMKPLAPGKYNVEYSAKGYMPQVQRGVVVSIDKSTSHRYTATSRPKKDKIKT